MTVVAVDDEKMALEALSKAIREAVPEAELHSFRWSEDAWPLRRNPISMWHFWMWQCRGQTVWSLPGI